MPSDTHGANSNPTYIDGAHKTSLLIIEDDVSFAAILARRLERHNYIVTIEHTTTSGLAHAQNAHPSVVLLDMKVADHNGIHIIPSLRAALPRSKIILLTGYASIATAVEAIKSGADDYLAKPIDGPTLLAALGGPVFTRQSPQTPTVEVEHQMSTARLEWEHIQQALKINKGNISATARQLNMHRRTLQRKLAKKPRD